MTGYALLKLVHVSCVVASGAGFFARGLLRFTDSPLLATRFARTAPHVVDTLLLVSAISMAWIARLSPLDHPWLATKIGVLLVYIACGRVALKHPQKSVRSIAFVLALLAFAYIVSVALTRDPLPWT